MLRKINLCQPGTSPDCAMMKKRKEKVSGSLAKVVSYIKKWLIDKVIFNRNPFKTALDNIKKKKKKLWKRLQIIFLQKCFPLTVSHLNYTWTITVCHNWTCSEETCKDFFEKLLFCIIKSIVWLYKGTFLIFLLWYLLNIFCISAVVYLTFSRLDSLRHIWSNLCQCANIWQYNITCTSSL